jgi:hypothetical protein
MSEEFAEFSAEIADQIESFLLAIREIARGDDPSVALSLLLLEVSQLGLAGGRLGAISDVVPDERFEPDPGPDHDVDELRERLAKLLDGVDEYVEVVDPIDPSRGVTGFRISDELASIASDLLHGLTHYADGQISEALWWWQFSYLSSWGSTCGATMRALHSLIAHTRLDQERDPSTQKAEERLLGGVEGDPVRGL